MWTEFKSMEMNEITRVISVDREGIQRLSFGGNFKIKNSRREEEAARVGKEQGVR